MTPTNGENEQSHSRIHFGCWHGIGHFFHDTKGRSLGLDAKPLGLPWDRVDGRLTPGKRDSHGRLAYEDKAPAQQGKAALHRKDGWTALAIHDYTIDSRPGSNTVLFFHAELDPDEVLFSLVEFFPTVERRIGEVQIIEVHDHPLTVGNGREVQP